MEELNNYRVVLLDGDNRAIEILIETLRGWGLLAEGFAGLEAALQFIRLNGCDLLLIEVSTPDLTGLIQDPLVRNDMRIILTAERAERDRGIGALRFGAFDLIEKPFDYELVKYSISRALTNLRYERQAKELMEQLRQSRSELIAGWSRMEKLNDQLLKTRKSLSELIDNIQKARDEIENQFGIKLMNLLMPTIHRMRRDPAVNAEESYREQIDELSLNLEDFLDSLERPRRDIRYDEVS